MSKIMNYTDILQQENFLTVTLPRFRFQEKHNCKTEKVVKAMKNYCMMPFIKISGSLNLKLSAPEISFIYKDIDYYLKI